MRYTRGKGRVRFSLKNVTYGHKTKRRKGFRKNCTLGGRGRERYGSAKKKSGKSGKVVRGKGKGKMKTAMNPSDILGDTGPGQGIE